MLILSHPFLTLKVILIVCKKITKGHLTPNKKTLNLSPTLKKVTASQEVGGFSSPYDIGASAPFGIALFLCQKSIFMMGVSWGSSDRRFLCHGLLTRVTSIAQSLVAFRDGLANQTKGKDYAQHIQHSSSHQSATSQNPNPFNPSSLHAHQGRLPFAFCASPFAGGVA